jgi:uncharacterized OB-fold protein
MDDVAAVSTRTPLREGLLSGSLEDLNAVRLTGARCLDCAEVALGQRDICPNCGGGRVETIALADHGTLWGFTVIRHRPPGDHARKDPFEPFGLGLVELPDGLRILAPLDDDIADLKIGMSLRFRAHVHPMRQGERVHFSFASAEPAAT